MLSPNRDRKLCSGVDAVRNGYHVGGRVAVGNPTDIGRVVMIIVIIIIMIAIMIAIVIVIVIVIISRLLWIGKGG